MCLICSVCQPYSYLLSLTWPDATPHTSPQSKPSCPANDESCPPSPDCLCGCPGCPRHQVLLCWMCGWNAQAGLVRLSEVWILIPTLLPRLIKLGAEDIQSYLQANYCPTLEDQELCQEHLAEYYIGMLVSTCHSSSLSVIIFPLSSSLLSPITSWMELSMSVRLWGFVMQEGRQNLDLLGS